MGYVVTDVVDFWASENLSVEDSYFLVCICAFRTSLAS